MEATTPIIIEQNKLYEEAANRQRDLDAVAKGVGDTFSSVGDKISDAMFRGKLATLNFKDILLEAVIALQKMVFKVLVLDEIQRKIEERIKGSKGFSLGDIFGAISGAFGGNGGNVGAHAGSCRWWNDTTRITNLSWRKRSRVVYTK
jgi:hypothetical protein